MMIIKKLHKQTKPIFFFQANSTMTIPIPKHSIRLPHSTAASTAAAVASSFSFSQTRLLQFSSSRLIIKTNSTQK
jgi:hypothetical protein